MGGWLKWPKPGRSRDVELFVRGPRAGKGGACIKRVTASSRLECVGSIWQSQEGREGRLRPPLAKAGELGNGQCDGPLMVIRGFEMGYANVCRAALWAMQNRPPSKTKRSGAVMHLVARDAAGCKTNAVFLF